MVRRFFVTEKVNEPPPSFAGAVAERLQLSEVPSLVKEGWPRHQEKCREATFDGADGVVGSTTDNRWLQRTTPSAPAKEASRHFPSGRIHPSFTKEGTSPSRDVRQHSPRGRDFLTTLSKPVTWFPMCRYSDV